jgi:hypothetical protein
LVSHRWPEKKGREGNDARDESGQERIVIHRPSNGSAPKRQCVNSVPALLVVFSVQVLKRNSRT